MAWKRVVVDSPGAASSTSPYTGWAKRSSGEPSDSSHQARPRSMHRSTVVVVTSRSASGADNDPATAARHIEQRPVIFHAQAPRECDFFGDGLPIDIIIIAGADADAQQPVLPHLDQPLRSRMKADH